MLCLAELEEECLSAAGVSVPGSVPGGAGGPVDKTRLPETVSGVLLLSSSIQQNKQGRLGKNKDKKLSIRT